MPFDWSAYKTLAIQLSHAGNEESDRSAISRAYYFAYHAARVKAEANGYKSPKQSAHAALWRHYKDNSDRECKRIGVMGGRMKKNRVSADYLDTVNRVGDLVTANLLDADDCEAALNKLPVHLPETP